LIEPSLEEEKPLEEEITEEDVAAAFGVKPDEGDDDGDDDDDL